MTRPSCRRLQVAVSGHRLRWTLQHCGSCRCCRAGYPSWCQADETRAAPRWSDPLPAPCEDPTAVVIAATALDLLRTWGQPATLLLAGSGASSDAAVALLAGQGVTCVAEPDADAERPTAAVQRAIAAVSESSRADLVIGVGTPLSRCARWVRRAGAIGAVDNTAPTLDIDTIVMREITVLPVGRPHEQLEALCQT